MITGFGSVAVLSNDPQKAAEWYRDKLGFEIIAAEGHSVFVKPKGSEFPILHLCGLCNDWGADRPGGRTGIWLASGKVRLARDKKTDALIAASDPNEVERTYKELKARGVEFAEELTRLSWGSMAVLKDLDGNEIEIS
jgi:lactoylglutathione lyase